MDRKKTKSNKIFLKIAFLLFSALVIFPVKHVSFYRDSLKDVKVKSSNKSVAVIESVFRGSFEVHPKKPGTTKITITAVMNNKKVKKTGTVKVVPFQNPFKSLKVSGRKYN